MACFIVTLPSEIQSLIFCSLEDLDDALSLSRTCQKLRDLYVTDQKIIDRAIVTSSDVYEYDLCLSRLLKLNEEQAGIFHITKSTSLTNDQRPSHRVLLEAVGTDWNNHAVSSEDVDAIALRWRQMGYLRDLYLDDVLSKEFDLFRARFVAKLPKADRKAFVKPGLMTSSTSSSHLKCSQQYTHGFKARFYQSLCLHSMAIATLQLAKVAPDISEEVTRHPYESFIDNTYDLWIKQSVVLGGVRILLGWDVKLYCLEVFDFLYMFLLSKIIPFEMLDAWIKEDADVYPDDRDGYEVDTSRTDEWYSLLEDSRWVLKPHDIFDLIKHKAWRVDATFPQSKSMYMRVRGMFDLTHEGDLDFHSYHNRAQMVEEIYKEWPPVSVRPEEPCWWDHMRVVYGSPFLPGGPVRYQAETSEIQKAGTGSTVNGVQEANSTDSAVPPDTNAAETAETAEHTEHTEHTELPRQETPEPGDGDTGESARAEAPEHAAESQGIV